MIAELLLKNKIGIDQVGKKKFVRLLNSAPEGDDLLDEALAKLASAKRRKQVQHWITAFSNIRKFKQRAASGLVKKRILKMEEDKVLLLFRRKLYPEIDPRPEKRILNNIYEAIFTEKREIDPHTLVLVALCESTGLLKPNFDNRMLRERKARIKEIVSGDLVGKATKEAIEALQAAVMVVAILPAITAAAT